LTVAVWFEAMLPAVTVNEALLEPFAIVTLAGVVRAALLSERVRETLPTAALSRAAVQFALCPPFKLVGVQESEARAGGESKLMVAVRVTPAASAVTVALVLAPT